MDLVTIAGLIGTQIVLRGPAFAEAVGASLLANHLPGLTKKVGPSRLFRRENQSAAVNHDLEEALDRAIRQALERVATEIEKLLYLLPDEMAALQQFRVEISANQSGFASKVTRSVIQELLALDPEERGVDHEASGAIASLPDKVRRMFENRLPGVVALLFWEEVITDTRAFRAYSRLTLEELRSDVRSSKDVTLELTGAVGDVLKVAGRIEEQLEVVTDAQPPPELLDDFSSRVTPEIERLREDLDAGLKEIVATLTAETRRGSDEVTAEVREGTAELKRHVDARFQRFEARQSIAGTAGGDWGRKRHSNYIPFESKGQLFVGREDEMGAILELIRDKPLAVLYGPGGVGKTQLAVEVCRALLADDRSLPIYFLSAESAKLLDGSVAGLVQANCLNLRQQFESSHELRVAAVHDWLNNHSNWILVCDGVDEQGAQHAVRSLRSQVDGGTILVTGRYATWPPATPKIEVDALLHDSAVELLRTHLDLDETSDSELAEIVTTLGRFPVALEVATGLMAEEELTPVDFLDRWNSDARQILGFDPSDVANAKSALLRLWNHSIQKLSDEARAVLELLSWFASEPLPIDLLAKEGDSARTQVAELGRYSLVRRVGEYVAAHQEIQHVVRVSLKPEERTVAIETAVGRFRAYMPSWEFDVGGWASWRTLEPHALELLRHAGASPDVTDIMNALSLFQLEQARYEEAEALMRRGLEIAESNFGENDVRAAGHMTNLGQLLQATDRKEEAEVLMRHALHLAEASFGENDSKVAPHLNNLAVLLQETNQLDEAESLTRRALQIDVATYGTSHPEVARDLTNLGALLRETNRLSEAEKLIRRALDIDESSYGSDHPRVAVELSNLAQILQETSRRGESERLMRRALEIVESSYGPDHPQVAGQLSNLAQLMQATGRLDEAEPMMRRALEIDETSYGSSHPAVARDMNNLAGLLQATGRLDSAEQMMRRALEIDERSYGPDHPRVATRMHNIAGILYELGQLSEAEPFFRRALEINEASFGSAHPRVATGLSNLAELLQDMNRSGEAELLVRRALGICESFFEGDHPEVARLLNTLGYILRMGNRLDEADAVMCRALEVLVALGHGPHHQHPHLTTCADNYAALLLAKGLSRDEVIEKVRSLLHPPSAPE